MGKGERIIKREKKKEGKNKMDGEEYFERMS